MPRQTYILFPALFMPCLVLLHGCALGPEGSRGTGAVLTSDGRFVANTDRNERSEVCRHIAGDLGSAVGPEWKIAVTIDELPLWKPGMLEGDGDWRWQIATARVALTGTGMPRVSVEEITTAVEHYLGKRAGTAKALVTIAGAGSGERSAERDMTPTAGVRTYTVQAGDTLADITTLFYGSPAAWRTIVAANPGLDPAALSVGSTLTIPAQPQ